MSTYAYPSVWQLGKFDDKLEGHPAEGNASASREPRMARPEPSEPTLKTNAQPEGWELSVALPEVFPSADTPFGIGIVSSEVSSPS